MSTLTEELEVCRYCEGGAAMSPAECPECEGEVMVRYEKQADPLSSGTDRQRTTDPINVRWRKKPIVIEAVRVTAADFNGYNFDGSPFTAVPLWLQEAIDSGKVHVTPDDRDYAVWGIKTLEGTMLAMPGDWIIRGVKGELYPCKNDIFEATYEPA